MLDEETGELVERRGARPMPLPKSRNPSPPSTALRACDFLNSLWNICWFSGAMRIISKGMSEVETEKLQSRVRLRVAERRQMGWVAQCPDDLIGPGHPVRLVMAVVEKMDLCDFHEPIKS